MGWHFAFVSYSTFAFGNKLGRKTLLLDLIGACFLLVLTVTSFTWVARRLSVANWRRLHKLGVYVIWLLATDIYLADVRSDGDALHFAILSALIFAWGLRIAAWAKKGIFSPLANP
jgi:DMSO/TMAO reductase YedYZ heme-binding membrane subunit